MTDQDRNCLWGAQLAQGLRESKRAVAREMKRTAALRALQDQINLFDQ